MKQGFKKGMAYITVAGGPKFSFILSSFGTQFWIKVVYQILNSLIIIHFTYPVPLFEVCFLRARSCLVCLFHIFQSSFPLLSLSRLSLFPRLSCRLILSSFLRPLSDVSLFTHFWLTLLFKSSIRHPLVLCVPDAVIPALTCTFLSLADPVVLGRALWLRRCRWRSLTLATTSWSVWTSSGCRASTVMSL